MPPTVTVHPTKSYCPKAIFGQHPALYKISLVDLILVMLQSGYCIGDYSNLQSQGKIRLPWLLINDTPVVDCPLCGSEAYVFS